MGRISRARSRRLCGEIGERVAAWLEWPREGEWTYFWIDDNYVKVR